MLPVAAPAAAGQAQQPAGGNKRLEPNEERAALVKKWGARIEAALKKHDPLFKQFEKRRKRVRGIKAEESNESISNQERTNLVFSTIAAILPQVYAKNPDISCTPEEGVPDGRFEVIKGFCQALESVIGRMFVNDAFLKKRAKAAVRSAMTTSVGWVKVTYQRDIRTDPIIQNRMNDVQDNLERVKATLNAIEDPSTIGDQVALKAQLEIEMKSLTSQVEKVLSEGLVIDGLLSEDVLLLSTTIRSFDGYRQCPAIAERIWFTKDDYETAFGYCPENATSYNFENGMNRENNAGAKDTALYAVFEIWDKDTNTVFTLCKGEKDFCREPYQPEKLGEHWYPFFPLGFNLVDGQFYPMSDVELLEKLSDEYNATREQLKDARVESRPSRYVRTGGSLTPEDIERVQQRKNGEVVAISGPGGKPLTDDIAEIGGFTINPLLYDTNPIRTDLDTVSGTPDFARGATVKAKTATEAQYLQAGLAGRTGERQDAIADWISDMALYAAEILVQQVSQAQVKRIAGETAVWPQMDINAALDMVNIEIRAGSMGKPNKAQEQEQWVKVLPILQEGMKQITELRAAGQNDLADSTKQLLRLTLSKFDEAIDLDSLIPQAKEGAPDAGQLMAQLQTMKKQLADLQQKADENQSAQTVALIQAAGDVITEREKTLGQNQTDLAAIVQEVLQQAANLRTAVPAPAPAGADAAAPQLQTEQVH